MKMSLILEYCVNCHNQVLNDLIENYWHANKLN